MVAEIDDGFLAGWSRLTCMASALSYGQIMGLSGGSLDLKTQLGK